MQKLKQFFSDFARDESGAQVVEYALIIALVSIVIALALGGETANGGLQGSFAALVTRVTNCLNGTACTAP